MGARVQHQPAYRALCQLLRTWRMDAGFSQARLSVLLGKPPSYVHKCEVGDRRVDPLEFALWYRSCRVSAQEAFRQIEELLATYGRLSKSG